MIKNHVFFNELKVARKRQELREERVGGNMGGGWQGGHSFHPQARLAPRLETQTQTLLCKHLSGSQDSRTPAREGPTNDTPPPIDL